MGTFGVIAQGIGGAGSDLARGAANLEQMRQQQEQFALQKQEQEARLKQLTQPRSLGIVSLPGGGIGAAVQDPSTGRVSLQVLANPPDLSGMLGKSVAALPKEYQKQIGSAVDAYLAAGDPGKALSLISSVNERLISSGMAGSTQSVFYTTNSGATGYGYRNKNTGQIFDAATNQVVGDLASVQPITSLPTESTSLQKIQVQNPADPTGPPLIVEVPTMRTTQKVTPGGGAAAAPPKAPATAPQAAAGPQSKPPEASYWVTYSGATKDYRVPQSQLSEATRLGGQVLGRADQNSQQQTKKTPTAADLGLPPGSKVVGGAALPGSYQQRAQQAKVIERYIPTLRAQIQAAAPYLGPVEGSLNILRLEYPTAVGGTLGAAPDPVTKLYASMKSFAALMPLLHGYRGASTVQKTFEDAYGSLARTPAELLAALNSAQDLVNDITSGKAQAGE